MKNGPSPPHDCLNLHELRQYRYHDDQCDCHHGGGPRDPVTEEDRPAEASSCVSVSTGPGCAELRAHSPRLAWLAESS